jgi:hypothetical protein
MIAWAALWMVWEPGLTLADRWAGAADALARIFPGKRRVGRTYQGFVKALIRWSPRLLWLLEAHLRTLVRQAAGKQWEVEGFVPLGVDGSRVAMPHTAANLAAFGRGGKARGGPSAWLVMLLHLGCNLPWAWRIARATADERGLLRQMAALLPAKALLIADAGYTGYEFWRALENAGQGFLIRVGSNVRLLTHLGYFVREHEGIVYLWPSRQAKAQEPPLILRLIVLSDGRKPVYLLTNVLDAQRLSDPQAAGFYRLRWALELFFRGLKQTLGKRQMRSHAPVQAALELRWAVLGMALLGFWTWRCCSEPDPSNFAVVAAPRSAPRISLAAALRHLRTVMRDPRKSCRPCQTLAARLAGALCDTYSRRAAKSTGLWPHKKNDPPPGAPKITPATAEQVAKAQALAHLRSAA